VYTTLQRLERDGLVASDDTVDESPQKGFHLTAEGEEELARWLRTPPDLSSPPRDELVIKVLIAVRLPGVDVHEVVQAHRRYLVQLMQEWTRLKEYAADRDLEFALVVDWIRPMGASSGQQSTRLSPTAPRSPGCQGKSGCGHDRSGATPGFEDLR